MAMRAIFISYRRNDSEGEAGRLFDDLVEEFGEGSVFMDVTTIEAGRDFRKVIDESVATCGVLLAIIGKAWLDAKDDAGNRRLDDNMDFVRLETASALRRDIPVIPIIVRGAAMPRPDQLPPDLKDLAYRNCIELTHARWTSDIQLLLATLRRQLGAAEKSKPATPVDAAVATAEPGGETRAGGGSTDSGHKKKDDDKQRWRIFATIGICAIAAAIAAFLFFPRQVTVPSVRGDTLAEATAKLEALHLKVGHTTARQDPTKDGNIVLSQFPPSDERVKQGTPVDLVISEPVQMVEVPAITGQSLDVAQRALAGHQLALGDVERQSRAGVERDMVLQQFPKPGEMVKSGAKIDVLASDVPPQQNATASSTTAAKTADEDWAAQRAAERAAAKRAAALKAAAEKAAAEKNAASKAAAAKTAADKAAAEAHKAAADKAAADRAAAEKAAADKAAADKAAASKNHPQVNIRSAKCTTLSPGKYRIDVAGDAFVPLGDIYLFYTWATVGESSTRWRPECKGWSVPQAGDDQLWEVTCMHRANDSSQMTWETSRIINTRDQKPPTNGGTAIFKPGSHSAATLKFSFSCQ